MEKTKESIERPWKGGGARTVLTVSIHRTPATPSFFNLHAALALHRLVAHAQHTQPKKLLPALSLPRLRSNSSSSTHSITFAPQQGQQHDKQRHKAKKSRQKSIPKFHLLARSTLKGNTSRPFTICRYFRRLLRTAVVT